MNTKTLKIVTLCVIFATMALSGCIETDNASIPETSEPISISTPEPKEVGTYDNPVPLNYTLKSDTGALSITVLMIERGNDIESIIHNENMFNDDPSYGNEYMLAIINVAYHKMNHIDIDDKFLLSSYDFIAYSNGIECNTPWIVLPDWIKTGTSINMMPGSSSIVYMIYEVPEDKQVTIAYDRMFVDSTYYFDAGNGNYPENEKPQVIESKPIPNPEKDSHTQNPMSDNLICPDDLSKYDRNHDGNLSKDEIRRTKNAYILNDLSSEQITAYEEIKDWYI